MNGTLTITTNVSEAYGPVGLSNHYNTLLNYHPNSIHIAVDDLITKHQINRHNIRSVIFTPSPVIITRY